MVIQIFPAEVCY